MSELRSTYISIGLVLTEKQFTPLPVEPVV